MTVAAAEVAVGLALLVALYKKRKSVFTDDMNLIAN
jgi:NADH:ubiquinone oxidoreductase subunit K